MPGPKQLQQLQLVRQGDVTILTTEIPLILITDSESIGACCDLINFLRSGCRGVQVSLESGGSFEDLLTFLKETLDKVSLPGEGFEVNLPHADTSLVLVTRVKK